MPFLSEIQLKKGDVFVVHDLSTLNPLVRRRLNDMGIVKETKLHYISEMPFGGPYMVKSDGQKIGIRRNEAKYIEVHWTASH